MPGSLPVTGFENRRHQFLPSAVIPKRIAYRVFKLPNLLRGRYRIDEATFSEKESGEAKYRSYFVNDVTKMDWRTLVADS